MWEQFDLQVLLEESEEKRWGLKAAVLLQQHWLLVSEVVAQNERESYLGGQHTDSYFFLVSEVVA